jgi:hypothetical protein
MAEPSIAPAPGLTKPADPDSGQKTQFALFSDSWIELQGYVGAAINLPITQGSFEEKYGTIGSSKTILDCIDAMKKVQAASTEFGDPKTLRAALTANPNLLATTNPPTEIYTHTVWLGQRVHETAGKIVSGYQSVLDGLPGLPPKEQVDTIKAYLFDQTLGPIPLSKQMSDEAGVLIVKLGKFEQKMNEYNEKLQAFTSNSSAMIKELDTTIGGITQKIKDLEKSRDDAYQAWKDFTIAAVTTSVGCALIGAILAPFTGGLSLLVGGVAAIATGVGLGVKAAQCRAQYNEYCQLLDEQNVELKKKQRLRGDLGDFNTQMQHVGPAMGRFLKSLQTVQGVWVSMNTDMLAISNSITPDNVGSLPFLVKAKAQLAIDSWKAVDDSAKQFTVESLVDYQSIAFGDKMPENMPKAA